MTVPSYTEEDVELVARVLNGRALFDRPAASSMILDPLRESYRERARAVLDALSSSGRLVPPGSEVREEWGVYVDENYALDASSEKRARQMALREGGQVESRRVITTPWSPSVPDTEESDDA